MKGINPWAAAFLVALASVLALRALAPVGVPDATVQVQNGGPRGLQFLAAWLQARGHRVVVETGPEALSALPADAVLIVPPPEAARFRRGQAAAVLDAVRNGAHLVLLCDAAPARTRRLAAFFEPLGVRCEEAGVASAGDAQHVGPPRQTLHFPARAMHLVGEQDSGRLTRFVDDAGARVAIQRLWGAGQVTMLADASPLANDGLDTGDNAEWLLGVIGERDVVVVETHHTLPYSASVEAAFGRLGPRVGFGCLALLLLLALVGQWPARGARTGRTASPKRAPGADVYALASLYRQVRRPKKNEGH